MIFYQMNIFMYFPFRCLFMREAPVCCVTILNPYLREVGVSHNLGIPNKASFQNKVIFCKPPLRFVFSENYLELFSSCVLVFEISGVCVV